jgi:hypothetical protein
MSVIIVSRGSYSRGKVVAEKVAAFLGYECFSREIILEASELFNIPEVKLVRAIHDAPSVLDRFRYGRERFIAFFRAALLQNLRRDNVVYHGLAGHFFVQKIPHVLKVRITADLEDRIREEMRRENISAEEAREILVRDDAERRKWGLSVHGVDTWDSRLYDLVLNVSGMDVDDAASIVLHAVQRPCFQSTDSSRQLLDDLALGAQVEAALVKDFPKVKAHAKNGEVFVSIRASLIEEGSITRKVEQAAGNIPGVRLIRVNMVPFLFED